jgi:hypothetical protein
MLLIDVLHEIGDREVLFEEIYSILKANGFVTLYPMHTAKAVVKLEINSVFKLVEKI